MCEHAGNADRLQFEFDIKEVSHASNSRKSQTRVSKATDQHITSLVCVHVDACACLLAARTGHQKNLSTVSYSVVLLFHTKCSLLQFCLPVSLPGVSGPASFPLSLGVLH